MRTRESQNHFSNLIVTTKGRVEKQKATYTNQKDKKQIEANCCSFHGWMNIVFFVVVDLEWRNDMYALQELYAWSGHYQKKRGKQWKHLQGVPHSKIAELLRHKEEE